MNFKSVNMKKIYFPLLALIFLSTFSKAQVKAYSFPSAILTEEIIAQRLEEARNKGTQEWEIENYKKGLVKLMKSQQYNLALEANGQNAKTAPPQVQVACTNV